MVAVALPLLAAVAALLAASGTDARARTRTFNDPCYLARNTQSNQSTYLPAKMAVACLDSFPFDRKVSDDVARTLINTLNEYAFLDIAKFSPTAEFPMRNDMVQRIKDINAKDWETDREVQTAYKKVFTDAHDAHTLYYSACMSAYRFIQPFDLHTILVDGKQVVKVGNVIRGGDPQLAELWKSYVPDYYPEDLRNYTILAINGKSPLVYLKSLANNVIGTYKDFQARFNSASGSIAYEGSGTTSYNFGNAQVRIDPPETLVMRYKFLSPTGEVFTVKYPWVAFQPRLKYDSQRDFKKSFCEMSFLDMIFGDQPEFLEEEESRYPEHDINGKRLMMAGPMPSSPMYKFSMRLFDPSVLVNSGYEKPFTVRANKVGIDSANYADGDKVAGSLDGVYPKPVLEGKFAGFYMISEKVGVAWIPSFAPQGKCTIEGKEELTNRAGDFAGFYCFIDEVQRGYKLLKKNGARRLIIDFSGNGGGYVSLGVAHNMLLFGNDVTPVARDIRLSPLVKAMAKAGFSSQTSFGAENFLDLDFNMYKSADDFLNNSRSSVRGGDRSEYSPLFYFNDGFKSQDLDNPFVALGIKLNKNPLFAPQHIMILTDGGCGSTCAQTTLQLNGVYGVKAIVKGGVKGRKPFAFSSFPGGNVIDYRQIINEVSALKLDKRPDAPTRPGNYKVLALRVDFSETYSYYRPEKPAEFDFVPGIKRLDIDSQTFWPPAMWKEVAETTFKIRKSPTRKPAPSGMNYHVDMDLDNFDTMTNDEDGDIAMDEPVTPVREHGIGSTRRVFSQGGARSYAWPSRLQDPEEADFASTSYGRGDQLRNQNRNRASSSYNRGRRPSVQNQNYDTIYEQNINRMDVEDWY